MTIYLDSSTVLRVLFRQPDRLVEWGSWEEAYSSELMGVEARRAIDRLRLESSLDDEGVAQAKEELRRIEAGIDLVPITRPVLRRAGQPMASPVKTLDAIHLATAVMLQEHLGTSVVFATHDDRQGLAARALGCECRGL